MVAGEDLEQWVTTEFFNRKDSALQWHVLPVPASHKAEARSLQHRSSRLAQVGTGLL